eukprot:363550-Chlamydomonas_euryale.AAC.4
MHSARSAASPCKQPLPPPLPPCGKRTRVRGAGRGRARHGGGGSSGSGSGSTRRGRAGSRAAAQTAAAATTAAAAAAAAATAAVAAAPGEHEADADTAVVKPAPKASVKRNCGQLTGGAAARGNSTSKRAAQAPSAPCSLLPPQLLQVRCHALIFTVTVSVRVQGLVVQGGLPRQ